MIVVLEIASGRFQPIAGNPTLTSLDGQVRAPLSTIMAPSWKAEDRAKFGVYLVVPFDVPGGKYVVGAPAYERRRDGVVYEVCAVEDIPAPQPSEFDLLRAEIDVLVKRIAALESKL